jgi:hypothetical protein
MALPIAQTPKGETKIKFTPELITLIEFTITILLVILGSFLYLKILQGQREALKKEIDTLQSQRDLTLEKEIKNEINFFARLRPVLENHTAPSKILGFLERNLLPNVTVNSLNLEPITEEGKQMYKLTLNLSALSPEILIEQFYILREMAHKDFQKEFQKINIGGVSIGESEYKIVLEMQITPKVLNYFATEEQK